MTAPAWRQVPLMPSRVDLRVGGTGRAVYHARRIYRPLRRRSRLVQDLVTYPAMLSIGRRVQPPLPDVEVLAKDLGFEPSALAARRSSSRSRWLLSFSNRRGVFAVAKVGPSDDAPLRNEADVLRDLSERDVGVAAPELLEAGEWRDRFVVVMRPLDRRSSHVFDPRQVAIVADRLARPLDGGEPLVHGDLTPWNVWRDASRVVVIDWEFAERRVAPLWDLSRFILTAGERAEAWGPGEAVELLTGDGGLGVRHVQSLGLAPQLATSYVRAYLGTSGNRSAYISEVCARLDERDGQRPVVPRQSHLA